MSAELARILGEARNANASLSPGERAWLRFKRNRRGFWSLWIFLLVFVLSLGAEIISNERPLLIRYDGRYLSPLLQAFQKQFSQLEQSDKM